MHMKSLALDLTKKGIVTHILCRAESPSAGIFSVMGLQVWDLWNASRSYPMTIMAVASMLRREKFDIVMVTREHDLIRTVLAWKLAFPFGNRGKLVICYHTATTRKQLFLKTADSVLCVSSFIRDKLLAANPWMASPVTVIPNGIPISGEPPAEKFTDGRPRRFFHDTGFPLIGMVGAFFKNQVELIEIIPALKREFPAIKVALIGDDTDPGLTGPIREKTRLLGVEDSLIFTGKIPHERLPDIYFDLDLSVSTFRNEGFGLIHLESLSAGTPVVAYNEGGQVDIFKGNDTGILVEGGTEQFYAAVAGLLRDNDKRFAMGRMGADLVKSSFSIEKMAENYIDFFTGLIGGTQARSN